MCLCGLALLYLCDEVVHVCVRACVCVRARARACVCVCVHMGAHVFSLAMRSGLSA